MSNIAFIRAGGIYSDSRSTKEIIALAEAGHNVIVIGWDRSGEAARKCRDIFDKYKKSVSFEFHRQKTESGSGIKNLTKFFSWFGFVEKTLRKIINDVEWVHACDLDSGWPAYRVCKRLNKKLVYDIFDYYVDSHSLPTAMRGVVEKMEISVINYADTTIICTEERREQIQKANPHKVVVIHNSPDVREVAFDVPEVWDYVYCGAFVEDRLIKEVMEDYTNHKSMRVLFAGGGKYQSLAEECAKEENFVYKGKIPYSEVLDIESQTAVLSAIYSPSKRNHRLCAPNKFYEALALGKPVIVCRGTGIDRIVKDNDIGAVIEYDVKEFYDALSALLSNQERRKNIGERARRVYLEKYDWSIMEKRLLAIYNG